MDALVIRRLLIAAAAAALAAPRAAPARPGPEPSSAQLPVDTSIVARRGDALVVETLDGRLLVQGWEEDRVSLEGAGAALRRQGERITLAARRGRDRDVVARLRVPRWMPVSVSGRELEVEVDAMEAPVSLRSLEGDLRVSGVTGPVTLRALDGEVRVTDVRGSVSALAVEDAVVLRGVRGDVRVESTDGDLFLEDVDGRSVEAVTVDGDVAFDGLVVEGGRYRFITHDGDVTVRVPEGTDADVTVSTYDGEFQADFPVVLDGYRGGREMGFTLGAGGATLVIQAFDGDIRLGWR